MGSIRQSRAIEDIFKLKIFKQVEIKSDLDFIRLYKEFRRLYREAVITGLLSEFRSRKIFFWRKIVSTAP